MVIIVTLFLVSNNLVIDNILYETDEGVEDKRVKIMTYEEARKIINNMDCVISCTSAPHLIIEKKHINEVGKEIIIFDLAMPRDIDERIKEFSRVKLYDIDEISSIDDENKNLRKERMLEFKYIIKEHIDNYLKWKDLREVSDIIKSMKKNSLKIVEERQNTLQNKCHNGF